jgi:hypothetical protein
MKTTHEKLLISLLALGLTSSAGLYGQSTAPIGDDIGGIFAPGISSWSYDAFAGLLASEDADGDGVLDQTLDLNQDGDVNNGGTGVDANGNTVLLAGEGPLLDEVADGVDYNGDGDQLDTAVSEIVNGDSVTFVNEDADNSGFITGFEDRDGDGNLDVNEDIDGDNALDQTLDLNQDGIVNNGGTGPVDANGNATLLAGEGALLDETVDLVDYNGDGDILDAAVDETVSGDSATFVNEDIDGDGQLDLFNEDINRNGVLDTDLPDRNFMASLDVDGDYQDIDFLVENGLFVNGEQVATQNYVDNADAILQGQITTNTANIATNTANIATNTANIATNREDIDRNTRGIAMVAALQTTTVLPGMTQALDLSAAHFEGETGLAINYSRRINDNVQINFGAATTSDGDENVVKAGIGWQW